MENQKKTKIICLEGLDGIGKGTLADSICSKLEEMGSHCAVIPFPRYETLTGRVVRAFINGDFGDPPSIDPSVAAALYTINRLDYFHSRNFCTNGDVVESVIGSYYAMPDHAIDYVIMDRSYYSNFMYQGSKIGFDDSTRLGEFITSQYLEEIEKNDFLRRAVSDNRLHVFYLLMEDGDVYQQVTTRGEAMDYMERNRRYQQGCNDFVLQSLCPSAFDMLESVIRGRVNGLTDTNADDMVERVRKAYFSNVSVLPVKHIPTKVQLANPDNPNVKFALEKILDPATWGEN